MGVGMGTVPGWPEAGTWLLGDHTASLAAVSLHPSAWHQGTLPILSGKRYSTHGTLLVSVVWRARGQGCVFGPIKALPFNRCFWIGGMKQETESILKDLQKHFRGEWFANIQDLTMVTTLLSSVDGRPRWERLRGGRGW